MVGGVTRHGFCALLGVSFWDWVAVFLSPVGDLEVIFELPFLPLLALMDVRFGDRQVGKLGSSGGRRDGGSDLSGRACVTIPSICQMDGVERRS